MRCHKFSHFTVFHKQPFGGLGSKLSWKLDPSSAYQKRSTYEEDMEYAQIMYTFNISFDRGVRDIEISTVDGFQGQEKEVIVFSCVRAKNQSRSIG